MKKSIFIFAALFAATFANAELTPEHIENNIDNVILTIPELCGISSYSYSTQTFDNYRNLLQTIFPQCPFFVRYEVDESGEHADYVFINASDYTEYKRFKNVENGFLISGSQVFMVTYDIFAVDKLAFLVRIGDNNSSESQWKIIDEDGNVLLDLNHNSYAAPMFQRIGSTWKLTIYDDRAKVYKFPGDGSMPSSSQAISNPSPKKNALKVVREGQVLIETENSTYDLRGQEVK